MLKLDFERIIETRALSQQRTEIVNSIISDMMVIYGLSRWNYYEDIEKTKKGLITETCSEWVQNYLESLEQTMKDYKMSETNS